MTSRSHGRHGARRGTWGLWLVALIGLALPTLPLTVGCHSLSFLRPRDQGALKADQAGGAAPAPASLPGKYQVRVPPYVFLSDFEITRDQPLFVELAGLRDQVQKELLLPPGTATVQVYLFETEGRYRRFMKERYPELPPRRAFFVAQPRSIGGAEDLLVYTYWGDRIRQDLRHELTHALLHSVIRDVPLWLDEGLAEYFELPPDQRGVNSAHVDALRRSLGGGTYRLNLARLEAMKQVEDMGPAEYREAWAWTHLMMHSRAEAKTALLSYLQQLRGSRHPGEIGPKLLRIYPNLEEMLKEHIDDLQRDAPRAQATVPPAR